MSRSPSVNHVSAPRSLAQRERVVGLVPDTPAALLIQEAGERVQHGVEVRRDVEAEKLEVVADVADRRDRFGPRRPGKRIDAA